MIYKIIQLQGVIENCISRAMYQKNFHLLMHILLRQLTHVNKNELQCDVDFFSLLGKIICTAILEVLFEKK